MSEFQIKGINVRNCCEPPISGKPLTGGTPMYQTNDTWLYHNTNSQGYSRCKTNTNKHFLYTDWSRYNYRSSASGKTTYPTLKGYAPSPQYSSFYTDRKGVITDKTTSEFVQVYLLTDSSGQLWLSSSNNTNNPSGTKILSPDAVKLLSFTLCGGGGSGGPGCWWLTGSKTPGGGGGGGGSIAGWLILEPTATPTITRNKVFYTIRIGAGGSAVTDWNNNGITGGNSYINVGGVLGNGQDYEVARCYGGAGGKNGQNNSGTYGSGAGAFNPTQHTYCIINSQARGGNGGNAASNGSAGETLSNWNQDNVYYNGNAYNTQGIAGSSPGANHGGAGGGCPVGPGTGGAGGRNNGSAGTITGAGGGGGGNTVNGSNHSGAGAPGMFQIWY